MEANTILIVEDDAGLSELLSEKAEDCGYHALSVHNAMNALQWLKEQTPFLMILDYSLPDMNGKELITELMGKGIDIPPFIVSTGQGDERIAVEMMKLGARDYIIKDNNFLEMVPSLISKVGSAIVNENKLKLAEKALIESSQFNSQIIKSAQEGIIVLDFDLKYVVWNPFMENLSGLPACDVLGRHPSELFPFIEESGTTENIKKALQGEVTHEIDLHYDVPATGKSGWTTERTAPLYNTSNEITGAIITVRDNTERKLVEEKLKESEEKYRMLFNANMDSLSILRLDPAGNPSDFLELNDAAAQMLDYTKEELMCKNIKEIEAPVAPEIMQARIETLQTCGNVVFETLIKNKQGIERNIESKVVLLNYKGQPALMNISRDITEKIRVEKALKHSHDLMRYIIEHNRSAIAVHDRNLKYIYVSQRYLQDFKLKDKDIIGKHHYEVFPDLPQRWREVHQRSLAGEVLSAEDDLYLRDDGTMDWTRWECRPWYEPEGEIGGIVVYTEIITQSKRTLEALKESEEKYRFIFANNPQPMWIYDLETLAFLEVNEAAIKHYGYSSEEFLKMTIKDIRPVEDIPLLTENIQRGIFSKNKGDVWRHLKKNGEIMYVEISSHPILFNGRKARHILINDITNRTLAEKKLKLLSKAIEQSPVTVAITDKKGNIEYVNPKFTETTGYTLEEVKGKNPRFLKSGHHPSEYYQELWNTIVAGEEWTGEFQNKKKNGEFFWEKAVISSIVNNKGEIDYFFAVKEDITEKKKMLEELIQSKEKAEESQHNLKLKNEELLERNTFIQTILDYMPIGLALNSISEGKATYMNKKFQEIYGWSYDEITSIASFFEKVYPDKEYREHILESVIVDINSRDPQRMHWEDLYVTHKDGSHRVVNAVNIPLEEQNTMVSTVMDITALHQIQNDLIRAKEHAEESDRLKSAFLANMSHEIRTPMNSILGFSGLLKEPDLDDQQREEYFSIIEESGERMLNTINNIVNISKIEAGQMTVSTSETCVKDITTNIHHFIGREVEQKGLQIYFKTNEPIFIKTDKDKLHHILLNLVKNAIKFTDSGFIEIGYGSLSSMPLQDLMKDSEPDKLLFFVKDTGIGIRPEQQEFIFERFRQGSETLNKKYEGAGLGLSISKAYVEMLGGRIWVESEVGIGSTFYFTLPYHYKTELLKDNQSGVSIEGGEKPDIKLKILIAEDDEASSKFLKTAIKSVCKEMISAQNGEEAVEACRLHPDIDLILLDIQMPEMNGYDAFRLIRQFNSKVVVIAQTAYVMAGDKEKAMAAGFNDYITKPFNREKLLNVVKKHFNK